MSGRRRGIISAATLALVVVGLVVSTGTLGGGASAAKGVCRDGTPPPCKPSGGEGEAATNNLSFPAIFPDAKPASWVEVPTWSFATIATTDDCVTSVPAGTAVPAGYLCFYKDNTVWWLQERTQNKWQVFDPVVPADYGPLTVTAVDVGDLLESSQAIKSRQVRTEFTLLQTVDSELATALEAKLFSDATVTDFLWANEPVFAAANMSGAVPGTEQSIDEIQGTDYGPGPAAGTLTGTGQLVDPQSVKPGFDATVFSRGARLVIQKVPAAATLTWSSATNRWEGEGVSAPVVDIGTAEGTYTAEINAGGSLLYGYNWNTQTAAATGAGTYRLTFVLDTAVGVLNTQFGSTTAIANPGGVNASHLVPGGAGAATDGLAYVDVNLALGGGGGGGQGGR